MEDDIKKMDGDNISISSTERQEEAMKFKSGMKAKDKFSITDKEHPVHSSGDEGRAVYRIQMTPRNAHVGQKSISESDSNRNDTTRNLTRSLTCTPRSSTQSSSPTKTAVTRKIPCKNFQESPFDDRDSSSTLSQGQLKYSCNKQHCFNECQNEMSMYTLSMKDTCIPQAVSPKRSPKFINDELSEKIKDIDQNLLGLNDNFNEEVGTKIRTQNTIIKSTGGSSNPSTDITDSANDGSSSRSSPFVSPPTSTRDPDSSPNRMIFLPSEIRLQNVGQIRTQSAARMRRRIQSQQASPQKDTISSFRPLKVDGDYNREQSLSTSPVSITDSHNEREKHFVKDINIQHTSDSYIEYVPTRSPKLYLNKIHNSNDEFKNETKLNFPVDMISTPHSSRKSGSENDKELTEVTIPGCIVSPRKIRLSPMSPHVIKEQRTAHHRNITNIPEEDQIQEEKLPTRKTNVCPFKPSVLKNENNDQPNKSPCTEVKHCMNSNWFPENSKTENRLSYPCSRIGSFSTPRTVSEGKPTTVDIAQVISKIQESHVINKDKNDILIKDLDSMEGIEVGDDGTLQTKIKSPIVKLAPSTKLDESDDSTIYSVSIMETTQEDNNCVCLRHICESILNFFFSQR